MAKNELLNDTDWLRARYWDDRLSTIQIAVLAGVPNANATTVRRAMEKAGIPRRSLSEASTAAYLPAPTYTEKQCRTCGEVKELRSFYLHPQMRDGHNSQCKTCAKKASVLNVRRWRLRVIEALGNRCASCGITDVRVLAVDHIHGGGYADRLSKTAFTYYKSMFDHLEDFQILCHNCNHLKRILNGEHRRSSDSPSADDDGAELLI